MTMQCSFKNSLRLADRKIRRTSIWTRRTARLGELWISLIGWSLWCAYASQPFFVVSQPSKPSNQLVSGDAAVTRSVRGVRD